MQPHYICAYHLKRIIDSEAQAISHWTELFYRGLKAYNECRLNTAEIYFHAALEVALLRFNKGTNKLFNASYIDRPATLLVELFRLDERYDAAHNLLALTSQYLEYSTQLTKEARDFPLAELNGRDFSTAQYTAPTSRRINK